MDIHSTTSPLSSKLPSTGIRLRQLREHPHFRHQPTQPISTTTTIVKESPRIPPPLPVPIHTAESELLWYYTLWWRRLSWHRGSGITEAAFDHWQENGREEWCLRQLTEYIRNDPSQRFAAFSFLDCNLEERGHRNPTSSRRSIVSGCSLLQRW